MKQLLKILALCSLGAGLPTVADELQTQVPVELASALIGNGAEVKIYDSLPDDFPALELPDSVEVIGAVDQGPMVRVLLRSLRDNYGIANAALVKSILEAGWQVIPRPAPPVLTGQRGFVQSMGGMANTFCHDDHGSLNLNIMNQGAETQFQLYYSRTQGMAMPDCEARISQMAARPQIPALHSYLPRLELPEALSNMGALLTGTGTSGGAYYYESRALLTVDLPASEVYSRFNEQLQQQGWALDYAGAGAVVAGSYWTRTGDDDLELIGELTIWEEEPAALRLQFRVMQRQLQDTVVGVYPMMNAGFGAAPIMVRDSDAVIRGRPVR